MAIFVLNDFLLSRAFAWWAPGKMGTKATDVTKALHESEFHRIFFFTVIVGFRVLFSTDVATEVVFSRSAKGDYV